MKFDYVIYMEKTESGRHLFTIRMIRGPYSHPPEGCVWEYRVPDKMTAQSIIKTLKHLEIRKKGSIDRIIKAIDPDAEITSWLMPARRGEFPPQEK